MTSFTVHLKYSKLKEVCGIAFVPEKGKNEDVEKLVKFVPSYYRLCKLDFESTSSSTAK